MYLRARYYDPGAQQFLTVDPLLAWTERACNHAAGSPLNGRDPSGLDANCGLFPNPSDENSCIREGFDTTAGKWVVIGGVAAAAIVTGGFVCLAGGCEAIAGALAIGGAGAEATTAQVLEESGAGTENTLVSGETCPETELSAPQIGDKVFRVWGGKSQPWGGYWTRVDLRTVDDYARWAGLDPWNAGRFVSEGYLTNLWGVTQTPGGGLDELFVLFPRA